VGGRGRYSLAFLLLRLFPPSAPSAKSQPHDRLWCRVEDYGDISVHPPPDEKGKVPLLFQLQVLMQMVPQVIVQGIPSIERAIVNKNKDRCAPFRLWSAMQRAPRNMI